MRSILISMPKKNCHTPGLKLTARRGFARSPFVTRQITGFIMPKLKMSSIPSARSALLASVALLVLVSSAEVFDSKAPAGQGYAIAVTEPTAAYPGRLPIIIATRRARMRRARMSVPMTTMTIPSSKSSQASTGSGRLAMRNGPLVAPTAMVRRILAVRRPLIPRSGRKTCAMCCL